MNTDLVLKTLPHLTTAVKMKNKLQFNKQHIIYFKSRAHYDIQEIILKTNLHIAVQDNVK